MDDSLTWLLILLALALYFPFPIWAAIRPVNVVTLGGLLFRFCT